MEKPRFRAALLHPRYWLTWLLFALWFLIAQLPYHWQLAMGRAFGRLMLRVATSRRTIAERNLALCFPELGEDERAELLRRNFESSGIALMETGMAWFRSAAWLRKRFTFEGLEALQAIQAQGQGVLLMAMHFTTLEIGAAMMGMSITLDGMYRPHKNPVYDYMQRKGRERHTENGSVYQRKDVRGVLRALQRGRAVWYAPDQDYGIKQGIFAPFFDVPAATVTGTSRFARVGKAKVVPYVVTRLDDGSGYRLKIYDPIDQIPSGDELQDAILVNQFIEARIREAPEQYMWVHRRFKTRPEGAENVYHGVRKKKKKRKRVAS
ncbi:LpxL/LpxP family Kdo(2)-lipid IV(A) lauroyl/palmitoleoyl acyltransferase [Microbulbifer sp. TRSA001]|uniref:LpxL/LpxP family Kdo(2)-lipid IV(A) lauroyl/palmitoleoyl acyltransferase n=1 Tax=unclassified Microbulbifer TaxID=2619833 RepID=UPI0024AD57EA|nr:LpxL/LpxP family Kdo(2)-lipid IV(A) lauroyl/palmitoleoyl acyltransferase [Microbulbifer sp. VAAF005]WHI48619.1 LpxL/LpxP family Kdo(2)-lipid IV(A) lauroyl/palmitoleoyl acyltransferase [Microbulbifer sp. VAAF005]